MKFPKAAIFTMKSIPHQISLNIFFLIGIFFMYSSCNEDDEETDPVPVQMLRNPYMELWKSNDVLYWGRLVDGDFELEWTDEEYVSPTHSLKISATSHTDSTYAAWAQALATGIPNGNDVKLEIKIKGVDLEGDGVAIALRGDDSVSKTVVQFESTDNQVEIKGTFDWTSYTVELNDVEENVDMLLVFLIYMPNTTGTVYFEDAFLTYIPQ
jgi:hypothetical protein